MDGWTYRAALYYCTWLSPPHVQGSLSFPTAAAGCPIGARASEASSCCSIAARLYATY